MLKEIFDLFNISCYRVYRLWNKLNLILFNFLFIIFFLKIVFRILYLFFENIWNFLIFLKMSVLGLNNLKCVFKNEFYNN